MLWNGFEVGNSTATSVINADGSATFAGKSPLTEASLRVSGDIDVGERLEQAQKTFQKLRAAVTAANNFADLKAAMLEVLLEYELN